LREARAVAVFRLIAVAIGMCAFASCAVQKPRENFVEAPAFRASVSAEVPRPRHFCGPPMNHARHVRDESSGGTLDAKLDARVDPKLLGPTLYYFVPHAPFWIAGSPTFVVRPGDDLDINYHDALPPIASDEAHGLPDDTNLHFHGLTTSPNPPGDDAMMSLAPLERMQYTVHVAADQPPGVYWYHPHPYRETSWQVGNGMAGAIVVDGIANLVPSLVGLRQRLIVVRETFAHPDSDEAVHHDRDLITLQHLTAAGRIAFLRARFLRSTATAGDDDNRTTVVSLNGLAAGTATIGIAPGEREFFRVVNATGHRNLVLAVDGESLDLISQDGVPIGYFPGSTPSLSVPSITVPPGGRAEFVVTGLARATTLRSLRFDSGPKGDPDPPFAMASLIDDGAPEPQDERVATVAPLPVAHPDYYRTPPSAPVAERTVAFGETDDGKRFFINGRSFSMSDGPMFVARSGTVEEWTIVNKTQEVHTFHLHQVHYVVESVDGVPVPLARRHWSDTFNVPYARGKRPGTLKILVDFRDPVVRGTFMFHCHILDHEDAGMMATVRVI
jgi:FtsP/CotA-like multicopper oxidase with cupredoxin domain